MSYLMQKVGIILFSAVVIMPSVLGLEGCEKRKEEVIFPLVIISPDGEKMAFLAGVDERPNEKGASIYTGRTHVLDLVDDVGRVIEITGSKGVGVPSSWAWRPATTPPQLFLTIDPIESKPVPIGLLGVTVSERVSLLFSRELTKNWLDKVLTLSWSPNGQILAVGRLSGLYLSYDSGKTFINVGVPVMSGDKPVWTDNETLYARNENSLLEIKIGNEQAQFKRTVAVAPNGKHLRICGRLNGKVVYWIERKIYCGNQLLYESDRKIGGVYADGSHVVLQVPPNFEKSHILVIDGRGDVINRKRAAGEIVPIGISSEHKFVYLLKNLQSIERYSFVDNDKIFTLYTVGGVLK